MYQMNRLLAVFVLMSVVVSCNKAKQEPVAETSLSPAETAQNPQADSADADAAANPANSPEEAKNGVNDIQTAAQDMAAQPQLPNPDAGMFGRQKIKNTKPWAKSPNPIEALRCKKGNCKCGKGHCAKDAWCIKDDCYCAFNLPWYTEYSEEDNTYQPDYYYYDVYIRSGDFGAFSCEFQDGNVIFLCEDRDKKCIAPNGEKIESGDFFANSRMQKNGLKDGALLDLCGRKSAEAFKRDFTPFEQFAKSLALKKIPDECKRADGEWDEPGSFNKACLFKSRQEADLCQIRRACDSWYIPREYRDQYVCEFDAGVHPGETHNDSYYYPRARGLRCIDDNGCVCTNVKIEKGEYCNGVPEYGYPLDGDSSDENAKNKADIRTFSDQSNLRWEALRDTYNKPFYHGKVSTDLTEFARIMSKQTTDVDRQYSNCTEFHTNLSDKMSVGLIQCEIHDEEGKYEIESCDADGQKGYPIGLFLAIYQRETNALDVHLLGDVYSNCGIEYFWSNTYEYTLKYAYAEPLGDTQALHVIVTKFSHNDDCEHERAVDGLDCRTETVAGEDRHYIIAGDDYRLMGYYPEKVLTKTVNGCGISACGESLEAELYESNLILTPEAWQFNAKKWDMALQFSTDAELEKARDAYEKDHYYIPEVTHKDKRYLKNAEADLTFEKEELKPFLVKKSDMHKTGAIREGAFELTRYDLD